MVGRVPHSCDNKAISAPAGISWLAWAELGNKLTSWGWAVPSSAPAGIELYFHQFVSRELMNKKYWWLEWLPPTIACYKAQVAETLNYLPPTQTTKVTTSQPKMCTSHTLVIHYRKYIYQSPYCFFSHILHIIAVATVVERQSVQLNQRGNWEEGWTEPSNSLLVLGLISVV